MIRPIAIALSLIWVGLAEAKPSVSTKTYYYDVSGGSAADIRQDLRENGPNGYWAYTNWYVSWTGSCQITVEIDITLPRLVDRERLPKSYLVAWDNMIRVLTEHENQHAQHGINAANEIEDSDCRRAYAIIDHWAEQDRILDRETQNGNLQGVELP